MNSFVASSSSEKSRFFEPHENSLFSLSFFCARVCLASLADGETATPPTSKRKKIRNKKSAQTKRAALSRFSFFSSCDRKSTHTLTLIMATTSTVMKSSAMMNCSQQQQQRSSSLSSRRISSSSKRSIGVSLNRRKQNSSSSSRKETVVVSASSA